MFALLTTGGTAMPETALTAVEVTNPSMVAAAYNAALAAGDWDGNRMFSDVTGNDYIADYLGL